jgi:hypothetical protein
MRGGELLGVARSQVDNLSIFERAAPSSHAIGTLFILLFAISGLRFVVVENILSMFLIGGLTGIMLAAAAFGFQLSDSHFVVGHFHWMLIGGWLPSNGKFSVSRNFRITMQSTGEPEPFVSLRESAPGSC